jgi:hypothetical protein
MKKIILILLCLQVSAAYAFTACFKPCKSVYHKSGAAYLCHLRYTKKKTGVSVVCELRPGQVHGESEWAQTNSIGPCESYMVHIKIMRNGHVRQESERYVGCKEQLVIR